MEHASCSSFKNVSEDYDAYQIWDTVTNTSPHNGLIDIHFFCAAKEIKIEFARFIEMDVTLDNSGIVETKEIRCRTCIKPASSQSLQQTINEIDIHSKTYGDLLSDLLQMDYISVEDHLPQKICKKCASLLKKVYAFILEAQKRQEELMQHLGGVTTRNCLREIPIDLPKSKASSCTRDLPPIKKRVQIKRNLEETEEPHGLLELVKVHIKTEPHITEAKCKKEQTDVSSKCSLNPDFESKTENSDLKNLCNDTNDALSATEDETKEDFTIPQTFLAVRCDICDKVYDNAVALKKHKTYTHMPEEQKIPCALCSFRSSRTSAIKVHLRTIHGPEMVDKYFKPRKAKGSFCCTLCPKRYSRKDDLQKHVKKVHINGENVEKKPKSEQKCQKKANQVYLCAFCGQSFAENGTLSKHIRIHTGDSPFKCEFCEKAFKRSECLRYHLVTHSDEKPHICSECGKSFKRKDKLRTHMRVHSELRPYKCNECEKTFKYSSVLKTHMQIHTGQTPFTCRICGENFSLRTSLNIHCAKNGHLQ
uniref:Protein krueppel n=1 Tax=Glossina austeni TaxID=7395 RepID=A0A1A9VNW9_GLOAU